MLQQARRVHGMSWGIGLVTTLVIGIAAVIWVSSVRYNNLVDRMHTAVKTVANSSGSVVPLAIENLNVHPQDLIVSHLETRFAGSNENQKIALAHALARYGKVEIDFLVSSISTAPAAEVNNLASALAQSNSESIIALRRTARACDSDKNWARKQRLPVVALHMGDASIASDMCQLRPDQLQRLDFILSSPAWHGDLARLPQYSNQLTDPALQSGLMVGLGNVRPEVVTRDEQQAWQPILADWFQNSDDAAVHNAAEWLLKRWELQVPPISSAQSPNEGQNWQVTKNGAELCELAAILSWVACDCGMTDGAADCEHRTADLMLQEAFFF